MKYTNESVLIDETGAIVLRKNQLAKVETNKELVIEGLVRFIGDGAVSFQNDVRISFVDIQKIKVLSK